MDFIGILVWEGLVTLVSFDFVLDFFVVTDVILSLRFLVERGGDCKVIVLYCLVGV